MMYGVTKLLLYKRENVNPSEHRRIYKSKEWNKLREKSQYLFLLKVIKSFAKLRVSQWNLKSKQILKLSSHEVHNIQYIL